ncbi:MAG: hypothetical protein U9O94_10780 [Nanoarchaeota archaeon]|nr:hypothetical protein [Nanoarchaeota archaeon]
MAKKTCPSGDFRVGNVYNLGFDDEYFDVKAPAGPVLEATTKSISYVRPHGVITATSR